jgi:hypothetical protein
MDRFFKKLIKNYFNSVAFAQPPPTTSTLTPMQNPSKKNDNVTGRRKEKGKEKEKEKGRDRDRDRGNVRDKGKGREKDRGRGNVRGRGRPKDSVSPSPNRPPAPLEQHLGRSNAARLSTGTHRSRTGTRTGCVWPTSCEDSMPKT